MTHETATNELRRLLDERGVHWWAGEDERKTLWESNGLTWEYFNDENGDAWLGFLGACEQDITPEQAIAATLGNDGVGRTNDGVAERERESCGKDAEQGERAEPSERESYATLRRTTTRNTTRTVYGNKRPICEVCGYGIGDRRWHYCPKCGAEVVE